VRELCLALVIVNEEKISDSFQNLRRTRYGVVWSRGGPWRFVGGDGRNACRGSNSKDLRPKD